MKCNRARNNRWPLGDRRNLERTAPFARQDHGELWILQKRFTHRLTAPQRPDAENNRLMLPAPRTLRLIVENVAVHSRFAFNRNTHKTPHLKIPAPWVSGSRGAFKKLN